MKAVPLGEIADFVNGFAFKPDDREPSGKKIIRIQNLTNADKPFNKTVRQVPDKYLVCRGDMLVSWSASLGVFEWHNEPALLNQHIFKVVPDSNRVFQPYLKYAIERSIESMLRFTHGSTMKHINRREFLETKIPLPPLEEQKRIATILDKADAIRKKRKQAIELAEQFLRSAFLDMFGDPIINPKGWHSAKLSELIYSGDKINYGVVQPGQDDPSGVPVVRIGDFDKGKITIGKLKKIAPDIEQKYSRSRLIGDEILIACVGSIGEVAMADSSLSGFNIVRAVARIRPSDEVLREFLFYYFRTSYVQSYFQRETRTVSQPTLNIGLIAKTPILIPPMDVQIKFRAMFIKHQRLNGSMAIAKVADDALFDSLTQRAFRGEL